MLSHSGKAGVCSSELHGTPSADHSLSIARLCTDLRSVRPRDEVSAFVEMCRFVASVGPLKAFRAVFYSDA